MNIFLFVENKDAVQQTIINKSSRGFQFGELSFVLKVDPKPVVIVFANKEGKFLEVPVDHLCLLLFANRVLVYRKGRAIGRVERLLVFYNTYFANFEVLFSNFLCAAPTILGPQVDTNPSSIALTLT